MSCSASAVGTDSLCQRFCHFEHGLLTCSSSQTRVLAQDPSRRLVAQGAYVKSLGSCLLSWTTALVTPTGTPTVCKFSPRPIQRAQKAISLHTLGVQGLLTPQVEAKSEANSGCRVQIQEAGLQGSCFSLQFACSKFSFSHSIARRHESAAERATSPHEAVPAILTSARPGLGPYLLSRGSEALTRVSLLFQNGCTQIPSKGTHVVSCGQVEGVQLAFKMFEPCVSLLLTRPGQKSSHWGDQGYNHFAFLRYVESGALFAALAKGEVSFTSQACCASTKLDGSFYEWGGSFCGCLKNEL